MELGNCNQASWRKAGVLLTHPDRVQTDKNGQLSTWGRALVELQTGHEAAEYIDPKAILNSSRAEGIIKFGKAKVTGDHTSSYFAPAQTIVKQTDGMATPCKSNTNSGFWPVALNSQRAHNLDNATENPVQHDLKRKIRAMQVNRCLCEVLNAMAT